MKATWRIPTLLDGRRQAEDSRSSVLKVQETDEANITGLYALYGFIGNNQQLESYLEAHWQPVPFVKLLSHTNNLEYSLSSKQRKVYCCYLYTRI